VRPGDLAEPGGHRRIAGREQQLSNALVASGELVHVDQGTSPLAPIAASVFRSECRRSSPAVLLVTQVAVCGNVWPDGRCRASRRD
jgi:hypothetical protein